MVPCKEFDDVVICPHCSGRCRQTNDYLDEKDNIIFALVPLNSEDESD